MRSVAVIRSAALRGFRATVAELGGDAEEYAQLVGLPAEALDTDGLLIPVKSMVAALEYAARQLDCPDIGLRVASRQDISILGPLTVALQSCSIVQDALTCCTRYMFLHSPLLALSVEPDPYLANGVVALRFGPTIRGAVHDQGTDLGIATTHRHIIDLVGGRYGLRSVELPYEPVAPLTAYQDFFQAPVRAGRPAALLRIPSSLLKQPIIGGGNAHLRQLAEAFLTEQLPVEIPRRMTLSVRAALQQSLGTAPPDIAAVARTLTLHPRTLQRRLAEEHTTFAAILDDVRRGLPHCAISQGQTCPCPK